jgi:carbamoyltransferase
MKHILGISAFYHDSAAVLLKNGDIVAAAQEERFTRRKNDEQFPEQAIRFCLDQAGIKSTDLDAVTFYDKPITKFARMLETYLAVAPSGWKTFPRVLPSWLSEKLDLRRAIREGIPELPSDCPIHFTQHHESHAASAFYPSPFDEAAILTVDGVGEWATTTIARGKSHTMEILKEIRFPHSIGLLYSAFTAYCGFRVNSGEYKLMGLAPYGQPAYVKTIYSELLDVKDDGSFWLNMNFFDFLKSNTMTNERFNRLFGGPPRKPETIMEPRFMDIARSIQQVTEETMLKLARHAREITGQRKLCLAGGVALNCVANGKILQDKCFDQIWIQPAAGDAGGALGSALAIWHAKDRHTRASRITRSSFQRPYLGPEYSAEDIRATLNAHDAVFHEEKEETTLLEQVAQWLSRKYVVGWMQGRMEYGPRALGNRSILGDPRSRDMQSQINRKIKFRESFRPFAPVVLEERASDFFGLDGHISPYMLLVADLIQSKRKPVSGNQSGFESLQTERSELPAITHVDYSARIQTVNEDQNGIFYRLLKAFEAETSCPVLINTSFNVRGEPIVASPDDAYRCFMNTEMDYLVMGRYWLAKTDQVHQAPRQTFVPIPD